MQRLVQSFLICWVSVFLLLGCKQASQGQGSQVQSAATTQGPKYQAKAAKAPVRVIFDTDVGGDVDDAGALAVLHALADRGEREILAMGVVIGHEAAVPYVHAVNTWYGRPNLPIGTIKGKAP